MANHRHVPRRSFALRLVPAGADQYVVRVTFDNERCELDGSIGRIAKVSGRWKHTVPMSQDMAAMQGEAKTPALAAHQLFNAFRDMSGC